MAVADSKIEADIAHAPGQQVTITHDDPGAGSLGSGQAGGPAITTRLTVETLVDGLGTSADIVVTMRMGRIEIVADFVTGRHDIPDDTWTARIKISIHVAGKSVVATIISGAVHSDTPGH